MILTRSLFPDCDTQPDVNEIVLLILDCLEGVLDKVIKYLCDLADDVKEGSFRNFQSFFHCLGSR